MRDTPHPVLDRSAKLRSAVDEYNVTSPDTAWRSWREKHRFVCNAGHEFLTTPVRLARREWGGCQECKQLGKLKHLREKAEAKGGVCLSNEFHGFNFHHRFRCKRGHEWDGLASVVLRGGWCQICFGLDKRHANGLERLQRKAAEHDGVCLTETYQTVMKKHRFRCAAGHEWETAAYKILNGGWCPQCSFDRKRLSIDDARKTASERGGKCLSTAYINSSTKLVWKCHRGHVWNAIYASVRVGTWCPECAKFDRIISRKSKVRGRYLAVGVIEAPITNR